MAKYIVGPGQTYETFAELEAAVVLQPDDIVDGGGNSFTEAWTPVTGGAVDQPLTLQNASPENFVSTSGTTYIALDNINPTGGTGRAIDFNDAADGFSIKNINLTDTNYDTPVWVDAGDGGLISGGTIYQGNEYMLVFIGSGGVSYVDNTIVEDLDYIGTVGKSFGDGFFLAGCTGNIYQDITINSWNFSSTSDEIFRCVGLINNTFRRISIKNSNANVFEFDAACSGSVIDNIIVDGAYGFVKEIGVDLSISNVTITDINRSGVESTGGILTMSGSSFVNSVVSAHRCLVLTDIDVTLSQNYISKFHTGLSCQGEYTVTSDGDRIFNCEEDGFAANHTGTLTVWRGDAGNNGKTGDLSAGDGFTSHDTAVLHTRFSRSISNFRDSHGVVGASSGSIYHHTAINNDQASDSDRAELYLTTTGVFDVQSSIFMNTHGYPLILRTGASAHTFDYNVYISSILNPFKSGSDLTWSQWIALGLGDTNSVFIHINGSDYDYYLGSDPGTKAGTLNYCPISVATGEPINRADNPILSIKNNISGIDYGTEADIRGSKRYGDAIPGCYQAIDVPKRGGRGFPVFGGGMFG